MLSVSLPLADGRCWHVSAAAASAEPVVTCLAETMQLPLFHGTVVPPILDTRQVILDAGEPSRPLADSLAGALDAVRRGKPARCPVQPDDGDPASFYTQVLLLAALFGAEAHLRGGALLHGALAVRSDAGGEVGVLLAAPGGTGKTTASNRLPSPWVSLCDDAALVLRASAGNYLAHPWPTWSRFIFGGNGGSWSTQRAVPLRAIFFLERAQVDGAERLGSGQAAVALTQSIQQISRGLIYKADKQFVRHLRLEWFDVAASMAHSLPCYRLRLSLDGPFWQEIERVLSPCIA